MRRLLLIALVVSGAVALLVWQSSAPEQRPAAPPPSERVRAAVLPPVTVPLPADPVVARDSGVQPVLAPDASVAARLGTLKVHVVDRKRVAIFRAQVTCSPSVRGFTDTEGNVTFELEPGDYEVEATSLGDTSFESHAFIRAGETKELALAIWPRNSTQNRLAGVVVDETGAPVNGVYLVIPGSGVRERLRGRSVWNAEERLVSGSDGTFETVVGAETATLRIDDSRFGNWKRTLRLPALGVRVLAAKPVELTIVVVDSRRSPVVGAQVQLTGTDLAESFVLGGPLRFGLVPRPVTLRALRAHAGRVEEAKLSFTLTTPETVELMLIPGHGIRGTVLDPHHVPLEGVRVLAVDQSAPVAFEPTHLERAVMSAPVGIRDGEVFTAKDGTFEMVPARLCGPYRLFVFGPGLREAEHPVLVELGAEPVTLVLEKIQ